MPPGRFKPEFSDRGSDAVSDSDRDCHNDPQAAHGTEAASSKGCSASLSRPGHNDHDSDGPRRGADSAIARPVTVVDMKGWQDRDNLNHYGWPHQWRHEP